MLLPAAVAQTALARSSTIPETPLVSQSTTIAWSALIPQATSVSETAFLAQTTAVTRTSLARQFLPAAFRPTAKILARLDRLGIASSVELLRRCVISVTDALSMAWVMLKCAALLLPSGLELLLGLIAIDARVLDIGVAVDVDIDLSPTPVSASPRVTPRSAKGSTCGKGKHRGGDVTWRVPWSRWIGRIGPRPINYGGIVGRDVHNLGIRGLNLNDFFLDDHFLFRCRLQITGSLRPGAESLYGIQDVFLLREENVTQFLSLVQLFAHRLKHLGKVHERLDARIPVLVFKGHRQRITF
jgi:hypothetical protein